METEAITKRIIYPIIRLFNRLIPKDKKRILFSSIPDYSDNSKALYEYLIESKICNDKKIVWSVNNRDIMKNLSERGICCCSERSIKGMINVFRSKYIIGTHNNFSGIKSNNQYLVNLWHGIPLKSMGFLDKLETESKLREIKHGGEVANVSIATSTLMRSGMVASFFSDPRRVLITGYPRNDYLFKPNSTQKLSTLLGFDVSQYSSLIIYMPTFRIWGERIEGDPNYLEKIVNIELNTYLKDNNILLVIKLHPFEEKYWQSKINLSIFNKNIVLLPTQKLTNNFMIIYEVLNAFNILITDYSSIYFDYLLLNRPIIFLPWDKELFSNNRGFLFEPYDFWTPGPKPTSIPTLIDEINKFLRDPSYYEAERLTINSLANQYSDGESSRRVWEVIKNLE